MEGAIGKRTSSKISLIYSLHCYPACCLVQSLSKKIKEQCIIVFYSRNKDRINKNHDNLLQNHAAWMQLSEFDECEHQKTQ